MIKINVLKIFLLFLTIVFISCQQENPSNVTVDEPIPDPEPFILKGSVFDVYEGLDTLFIPDISVRIDSLFEQTDEDGEFSFELLPGDYALEIISEDHLVYNDSITIKDDTNIEVELGPIYYDMLPLELGNQWTYSYFYDQVTAPIDVITTGTITYEIINVTVHESDTIYTFSETIALNKITYSSQFPNQNLENDTTFIFLENEYTITQDSNGSLSSNGEETPISVAFRDYIGFESSRFTNSALRLLEFKRYMPRSRVYDGSGNTYSDSLLVINKNPFNLNIGYDSRGSYTVKADVGITAYSYSDRDGLWYSVGLTGFNDQ